LVGRTNKCGWAISDPLICLTKFSVNLVGGWHMLKIAQSMFLLVAFIKCLQAIQSTIKCTNTKIVLIALKPTT
jgi:hypothetical protein